ncbi:reverse transcriptase, partial [Globisporangium splendens]
MMQCHHPMHVKQSVLRKRPADVSFLSVAIFIAKTVLVIASWIAKFGLFVLLKNVFGESKAASRFQRIHGGSVCRTAAACVCLAFATSAIAIFPVIALGANAVSNLRSKGKASLPPSLVKSSRVDPAIFILSKPFIYDQHTALPYAATVSSRRVNARGKRILDPRRCNPKLSSATSASRAMLSAARHLPKQFLLPDLSWNRHQLLIIAVGTHMAPGCCNREAVIVLIGDALWVMSKDLATREPDGYVSIVSWMKEEQAELKKMNGGLSVPNIRTELMTMSATAVSKWAITTSHIDQVIGEILLHNTRASSTYITPLDAIPRRPLQLRDNMWTTGAALCASLHSRPYEPRERDNVRWCYEHFKSTIVQTQWDGDVFQIDLSSKMSDRLPGIIAEGRKLRGTFCAEWLPYMTSTADGWLLDSNGSPYKLAHTSLSVGTAQLGDILRWEWIRPGVLNFIPTCGISGFSRPSIRALERLCATLVSNFPQLLYRPQQTNVLRLYNGQRHYNHEWHLHTSEATRTHVDTTLVKATHTVHSAMDCDIMATRDLNGQKEKADLSCSSPECSQVVQSSVQHLFCECPKAKLVWNYFYALWAKIGITPGHDPAIWIFSLDLPDTPRHAWTAIKRHIIGHKCSNEHLQDHLYPVAHMLWRYMSASLIQAIWCAHLRRMDSDPIKSTAEMAIMMTRLEAGMRNLIRLAEAQAGDSDGHTSATVLKAYIDCFLSQTDAIPLTPNDTRGVYLLFFDGGSRGNPGPGGTGSIIVRVHKDSHTASLIWAASMAYSRKDTTNNFAEYWGLIHGLREAQRSHFEPLYVIGDSALIISQQRMHRSPRQHRLARLYQTSRRLADCIDIRGWYHHYRAFNKMADSAANLAMDTRTSTQVHFPTHRAAFNNLTQDLDNDVMHWLMRSSEDPRSLDNTRQPHIGPREHAILVKDYLAFRSDLLQSAL